MLLSLAALLFLQSTPALGGLDPVELCLGDDVPGLATLEATWGRHTYRFASEETRKAFLADPEKWGIQWGGACGRMGPLSGVGSPDRYTVHRGQIWIFASEECQRTFEKAPERFVADVVMDFPRDKAAAELGRAWVERAARAHGSEVFDAKKGLRLVATGSQGTWKHREELLLRADGGIRRSSVWTPSEEGQQAEDTTWVLGRDAFTVENGQTFDLATAAEKDALRRFAHRQPLYLLWARRQPGFRAAAFERREGDEHVRVAVEHAGLITELYLDPDTAEVRGLFWIGRLGSGNLQDIQEFFTEVRDVDGVKVPVGRRIVRDRGENKAEEARFEAVELLAAFPEEALVRPR